MDKIEVHDQVKESCKRSEVMAMVSLKNQQEAIGIH